MRRVLHLLLPLVLPAALALGGCASSGFTESGTGERPEPWRGEVKMLRKLPPEGTYRLLGVVSVKGVALTSDQRMYDNLLALAAERGANAVVLQDEIRTRVDGNGGEERRLAGYAIRQ